MSLKAIPVKEIRHGILHQPLRDLEGMLSLEIIQLDKNCFYVLNDNFSDISLVHGSILDSFSFSFIYFKFHYIQFMY